MDEHVDPFYEYYYETGEDITGEIDDTEDYGDPDEDDTDETYDEEGEVIQPFGYTRVTPENIRTLDEGSIFVFGSNKEGLHGGGAARFAYEHLGAEWGVGVGPTGQCYAIPTMDGKISIIKKHVNDFIDYALFHPELMFYVTPIGCGIAGWTPEKIAPLFKFCKDMQNVALPKCFWEVLKKKGEVKIFDADYACLDFETANEQQSSVCSVGIVWVKGNKIVDNFYSLIHPEPDYYNWHCQQVHGLGPEDTDDAPCFPEVWAKVQDRLQNLCICAHNARFDEGCLKAVMRVYQMDYPDYTFIDTLKGSRDYFGRRLPNHQLQTSAAACGYDHRKHHHALADAEACAHIAMKVFDWK